jgi:hypothetical protein
MQDYGFKYKLGDCVSPLGVRTLGHQPPGRQFQVVTQLLVAGPAREERIYYIHPVHSPGKRSSSSLDTLRVQEEHLAPWSGPGCRTTNRPYGEGE